MILVVFSNLNDSMIPLHPGTQAWMNSVLLGTPLPLQERVVG